MERTGPYDREASRRVAVEPTGSDVGHGPASPGSRANGQRAEHGDRRRGLEPYLHLIYLVTLFPQAIFSPDPAPVLWATIPVSIALFLPLYWRAFTRPAAARLRAVAGMTLLGAVLAFVNTGASVFYVYAGAAAASTLRGKPLRWTIAGLTALNVAQGLLATFVVYDSAYAGISFAFTTVFILVVGTTTHFEAERARAHARLRKAQDEVGRLARIAERERIARDLHDLLGHSLSVVALKAELARKLVERDPGRAAREIADVERIARTSLTEMRGAVRGYRAAGLAGEVENARLALAAGAVDAAFELEPLPLDSGHESVLALVLRESVTNVLRHARATRCTITLERVAATARLTVRDDGVGSDAPEGTGLAGMRERLAGIDGTLAREVSPNGTTLRATVPLGAAGADAETTARPETA